MPRLASYQHLQTWQLVEPLQRPNSPRKTTKKKPLSILPNSVGFQICIITLLSSSFHMWNQKTFSQDLIHICLAKTAVFRLHTQNTRHLIFVLLAEILNITKTTRFATKFRILHLLDIVPFFFLNMPILWFWSLMAESHKPLRVPQTQQVLKFKNWDNWEPWTYRFENVLKTRNILLHTISQVSCIIVKMNKWIWTIS